ncbi:MAG: HNH endonuclease [Gallionella sp.]
MAADIAQQIESLTPADYVSAFRQADPAEHQLEMLRIHYAAPDHTLTARHLARGMGYKNWNAANLHYGKFAAKVCDILNLPQKGFDRVFVLAEFFKPPGSEVLLSLRPSVVAAIEQLGLVSGDVFSIQEEIDPDTPLVEGASYFVQVSAFERNPVARRKCIEHYGLNCSVCGFNFETNYGIAAKGYIHVHHLKPLASIGEEYVIDPIQDLRPVCSNCHSVIHLRQPPYSIEEVKTMQQCKGQ